MGNTLKCFIFFTFRDGPWGGCNQFLKALRNELQATGHWADTPESADVILLDSFNEANAVLALKKRFPETPFVQRMDGPISIYRGKDLHVDRLIHTISDTIPDGIIFQSHYSRDANLSLKMPPPRHSTVILNAANHEHFHRAGSTAKNGRIRIIATSWSSNRNKGFDVYTYLDQHLDFTRYSMTFVGNSPVTFTNIHHEPPKTTAELAQLLRGSDIYVTASRHESCSNSLLEALACGLPSVVIRSGGNPEILGRGGELFSGTNDVIPTIEKVSASLMQYKENITPRSIVDVSRDYLAFFEKVCAVSSVLKHLSLGKELKLRLRLAQWRFLSSVPHWHTVFRELVRNFGKALSMPSVFINKARNRLDIERRECQRWVQGASDNGGARVFYGLDQWFKPTEMVSGGIVKIIDLQNLYPNSPLSPNLLYLVSSALPPYADRMVWWAKSRGAKVVLNQNGVAYPAWHGPGWENTNRMLQTILKSADYIFYQSQFCKQAADLFLSHRTNRYEILLNTVDTDRFCPAPDASPYRHNTLLLAGTHTRFYRVQCAIETLAILARRHNDVRMVLAGKNTWRANALEAEQELRALARHWNVEDRIEYFGPYTQEQAVTLFQRSGILLHTKYNDPCPRLVAEALSCGLPVVYSASGGVPELVGTSAGIGVPAPLDWEKDHPPAPERLADAVCQVWNQYEVFAKAARSQALSALRVEPWQLRHQAIFETLTTSRKT